MSKHHHQSREEQRSNRKRKGSQSKQEHDLLYPVLPEDIQRETIVEHPSLQLQAYELYSLKGGPALDNWLEAQRVLVDRDDLLI